MEPIEIQVLLKIKENVQNVIQRNGPIWEPENNSGIIELLAYNNWQNEFYTHFFQVI